MTFTIYHNPACGTSRNVLAFLQHAGVRPKVVEYLKSPPTSAMITEMLSRAVLGLPEVMRRKGTPFEDLGLGAPDVGNADRLAAIAAHPILLNRPIVDDGSKVRLCRPSDIVLDFFSGQPLTDFYKEDGAPFLRDIRISGECPDLRAALKAAGLVTSDLEEPGRHFYAYTTLGGRLCGYSGFERFGEEALIRSVIVPDAMRGKKIGRNLVGLLLSRLYRFGVRRAWCLTSSAADYFRKAGFAEVVREDAPQSILSTRQVQSLCQSSSTLLCRTIRI